MKELLASYKREKEKIKSRLNDFKALPKEEYKKEFMFCILTPQSNAQRCWEAVEEISKISSLKKDKLTKILSTKTRFHHTKAERLIKNLKNWKQIEKELSTQDIPNLRLWLTKNVNGYGLKESAHFLRNIGKSENKISILDRHILKNLHSYGVISSPKIKSPKHYMEIESAFLSFANKIKVPADELDLLFWSQENGEIFK